MLVYWGKNRKNKFHYNRDENLVGDSVIFCVCLFDDYDRETWYAG